MKNDLDESFFSNAQLFLLQIKVSLAQWTIKFCIKVYLINRIIKIIIKIIVINLINIKNQKNKFYMKKCTFFFSHCKKYVLLKYLLKYVILKMQEQ